MEIYVGIQDKSVAFIVYRTITIEKSFSNLQIVLIENVLINVSYSIQESRFFIGIMSRHIYSV